MIIENNILKIVLIIAVFIIYHQYRTSSYPKILNQDKSDEVIRNYIKNFEKKLYKLKEEENKNNNKIIKQIKIMEENENEKDNKIIQKLKNIEDNENIKDNEILQQIKNLQNEDIFIKRKLDQPKVVYKKFNTNKPPLRKIRINYPTRGYPDPYQQVGILGKKDGTLLNLYGRQKWQGSNLWEYYAIGKDKNTLKTKIPVKVRGDKELEDDIVVNIPFLNKGKYKVKLYDLDSPRYIPYIF